MSSADHTDPTKQDLGDLPVDQLEAALKATPDGLSRAEAANRLEAYGYNELAEKEENPLLRFLSYFWGPIPWMIEIAVLLSAAGNRIWKKLVRSASVRAERTKRSRHPFSLRFRFVPDPIPGLGANVCTARRPEPRLGLENFHMR